MISADRANLPFTHLLRARYHNSMLDRILHPIRIVAVQLLFIGMFITTALSKWHSGVYPPFHKQFDNTWIAKFPGVDAAFYIIAASESLACILFILSLITGEFLRSRRPILDVAFTGTLLLFMALTYGTFLSSQFDVAAHNFFYFVGTMGLVYLTRERSA